MGITPAQKSIIIDAFKQFRKLFYDDEKEGGYVKKVEKEWKDNGKNVLKNLSSKKIIKVKGDSFEVDMIDDVLEFIKEAK